MGKRNGIPTRYPILGPASIFECPVHKLVVALNAEGRIASSCPACKRAEARAIAHLATKQEVAS